MAKAKPKIDPQFKASERDEVPFVLIIGENELKEGKVKVKEQKWEMQNGQKVKIMSEDEGVHVNRNELAQWLKNTEAYKELQNSR